MLDGMSWLSPMKKNDCSNQCFICFLIRLFPLFFYLFLKNVYLKCYLTLTSLNMYLLSLFSKYRYEQQKKKREQQKKSAGECLP